MATTSYVTVQGEIVSEIRNGVRRDYVPDPLGSTVALLDSSQNRTDTWDYWPYGEVRARTGANATPFQFVGTFGYYRDSSVRTYVRARYFRQGLGRWHNADPIGLWGGLNQFEYCSSRPQLATDPTGWSFVAYANWAWTYAEYGPPHPLPPGVGLPGHIHEAEGVRDFANTPILMPDDSGFTYQTPGDFYKNGWYSGVETSGGEFDYKKGGHPEYEPFGNWHAGVMGAALGWDEEYSCWHGGVAQWILRGGGGKGAPWSGPPYGDRPADNEWIRRGWNWYDRYYGGTRKHFERR